MTGTDGQVTDTVTFEMTLVNPCASRTLTIRPNIFVDHTYELRDTAHVQNWDTSVPSTLGTLDSPYDLTNCGDLDLSLVNVVPPLAIFSFDTDNSILTLPYTESLSYVGTYTVSFQAYLVDYNTIIDGDSFTITISDPCDPPNSLQTPSSSLIDVTI